MRRDLVDLRRVVLPMREVINAVLRHRKDIHAASELDPWYDDLYDHVLRVSEWTESLRDLISAIFETNLSLQDARLNNVMKKLTAWAAIIAVPTAVTGYFGQNVPSRVHPGMGIRPQRGRHAQRRAHPLRSVQAQGLDLATPARSPGTRPRREPESPSHCCVQTQSSLLGRQGCRRGLQAGSARQYATYSAPKRRASAGSS